MRKAEYSAGFTCRTRGPIDRAHVKRFNRKNLRGPRIPQPEPGSTHVTRISLQSENVAAAHMMLAVSKSSLCCWKARYKSACKLHESCCCSRRVATTRGGSSGSYLVDVGLISAGAVKRLHRRRIPVTVCHSKNVRMNVEELDSKCESTAHFSALPLINRRSRCKHHEEWQGREKLMRGALWVSFQFQLQKTISPKTSGTGHLHSHIMKKGCG